MTTTTAKALEAWEALAGLLLTAEEPLWILTTAEEDRTCLRKAAQKAKIRKTFRPKIAATPVKATDRKATNNLR
jgi:hypothetical protein